MKLLKRSINGKDSSGIVVLRPESNEDIWHLYNLIAVGDSIRSTTVRKVIRESYSTGSTTSQRKRLMLTIRIEKIFFDPEHESSTTSTSQQQQQHQQDNNSDTDNILDLRYSGIVTSENDSVKLNSYHTISVELNQNISIEKDCWDNIFLNIINESLNPEQHAEMTVIVLQPSGICTICVIVGSITITKAKISINIPKKRTGSSQHTKSLIKFFNLIYTSLLRHIDIQKMKCILIGSPGFIKNDFYTYMVEQATKTNYKPILDAIKSSTNNNNSTSTNKFILTRSSSGYKHSIEELFNDPTVQREINTTKIYQEITVLQKFMRLLDTDPDRAYYGYEHVKKVQIGTSTGPGTESSRGMLAIDTLLITDELFRSSSPTTRKQYIEIVDSVKDNGGTVIILSILHVPGQQLQQISGIAAILRYPVHDIDLLEELYEKSIETSNSNNNSISTTTNGHSANDQQVKEDNDNSSSDDDDDDDDNKNVEKRKAKLLQRIQEDVHDMGLL